MQAWDVFMIWIRKQTVTGWLLSHHTGFLQMELTQGNYLTSYRYKVVYRAPYRVLAAI